MISSGISHYPICGGVLQPLGSIIPQLIIIETTQYYHRGLVTTQYVEYSMVLQQETCKQSIEYLFMA